MTQLLERGSALALLQASFEAAAGGSGGVVLVSGEAGIGKTTLLERFADGTAGRVLWGACDALSTPHPLGPLHDLARAAQGPLRHLLAEGVERPALFAAVLDELAMPPSPVVLVLEDLHWADAATLDLVRYLGRRIHRLPALMLLSFRDDEGEATHPLRAALGQLPANHAARLSLQRLSASAVRELAGIARDAQRLHAATGGNPFFVTEVLANPHAAVPATVRDAVLGRAASLSAPGRDVLDFASLVPRSAELRLVEAVLAPTPDAVHECLASGLLLAEAQCLRFRHELARVAIEEAVARPRARAWHARALEALGAWREPAALARLVHHAQCAGDGDAVLRLAPRAAREAALRGARREAAAHSRAALEHAQSLPPAEHAVLLEDYALHAFELNELDAAIAAGEEAVAMYAMAGNVAAQARAHSALSLSLVRALRNGEADTANRQAIACAESLPPGLHLAAAYATESYLRMLNRDTAEAIAWGDRAIELAQRFDSPDVRAAARTTKGAAQLFVDYPAGLRTLHEALADAHGLADGGVRAADAYVMLGTASAELYRFAEANRYLAEGIAFAHAQDLHRVGSYMQAWRALLDVYQGHWSGAGRDAEALLAAEPKGSTNRLMALVALGRLRIRRGDAQVAPLLDEALELGLRSGTLQRIAPVRCLRAEAAWLCGDLEGTAREASAALELAQSKGHPWFAGEMLFWLHQAGERTRDPATPCAEPFRLQVDGDWRAAAAAWEAIGCPYEQARALADGDGQAQRRALGLLDGLGAAPLAARLRQRMRESGDVAVPRGPRASTRENPAGLTAREMEVLALLARGWATPRIAEALSRSPRTVEHHVAAILAKLGAGTRGEAVEAAAAQGLVAKMGIPDA